MCELVSPYQYGSHDGGSGGEQSQLIRAVEKLSAEVAKLCEILAERKGAE